MVKEGELWADVTPDMMSEEEKDGDVYIRHQPSYRSNTLNKFIKKLDQRLEADINRKNTHVYLEHWAPHINSMYPSNARNGPLKRPLVVIKKLMIQETALKSLRRDRNSQVSVMLTLLNWFSVLTMTFWQTMEFFSLQNCDDDVILIQFVCMV